MNNIDVKTVVTICCSVVAILLTIYNIIKAADKDNRGDHENMATIITRLDTIKEDISEMKENSKADRAQMISMVERITVIETKVKTLNKAVFKNDEG